jgi:uncharacterized LabA/DUF88 family protein
MRVIILIDAKNFEKSVYSLSIKRKEFRYIDFYKLNTFILEYLVNNQQYKNNLLQHLRTYFYTGEYTENLIRKIEKYAEGNPQKREITKELLEKCKKEYEKQSNFFKYAKNYLFFEIKLKPLQFSPNGLRVLQKGVDVQLAVDLVDFTHKNIFDIAVILSGDIDLIESIKTAKGMGKQIIIMGNSGVTAEEMKRYADLFIDIGRFTDEQLNKFTHIYIKKEAS